jgi:hypothetical protein
MIFALKDDKIEQLVIDYENLEVLEQMSSDLSKICCRKLRCTGWVPGAHTAWKFNPMTGRINKKEGAPVEYNKVLHNKLNTDNMFVEFNDDVLKLRMATGVGTNVTILTYRPKEYEFRADDRLNPTLTDKIANYWLSCTSFSVRSITKILSELKASISSAENMKNALWDKYRELTGIFYLEGEALFRVNAPEVNKYKLEINMYNNLMEAHSSREWLRKNLSDRLNWGKDVEGATKDTMEEGRVGRLIENSLKDVPLLSLDFTESTNLTIKSELASEDFIGSSEAGDLTADNEEKGQEAAELKSLFSFNERPQQLLRMPVSMKTKLSIARIHPLWETMLQAIAEFNKDPSDYREILYGSFKYDLPPEKEKLPHLVAWLLQTDSRPLGPLGQKVKTEEAPEDFVEKYTRENFMGDLQVPSAENWGEIAAVTPLTTKEKYEKLKQVKAQLKQMSKLAESESESEEEEEDSGSESSSSEEEPEEIAQEAPPMPTTTTALSPESIMQMHKEKEAAKKASQEEKATRMQMKRLQAEVKLERAAERTRKAEKRAAKERKKLEKQKRKLEVKRTLKEQKTKVKNPYATLEVKRTVKK